MGRYSKKRKQEEARIRAEDAKKTFVENILEFSEKQQEELERLERRINRKKIRSWIIFCSLKALVSLCIRTHMEIGCIDDRSGCDKG